MSTLPLVLASRRTLAPGVLELGLARADGAPIAFVPGQFLQLHLPGPDGALLRRSYSILDQASPADVVHVAISLVPGGLASTLLQALDPGAVLQGGAPMGRFHLMPGDANRRYLLLATGTGASPFHGMLPGLAEAIATRGARVVIAHGARTRAELLYRDAFEAFARAHPGHVRYLPCTSREAPDAAGWADARAGHVQQALDALAPDPDGDIAYLCGNPAMVDAGFEALKAHGFGLAQLRREKYISLK